MSSLAFDDPRHGTYNGYRNLQCRCERCREANRLQMLDYRGRRRHHRAIHRSRTKAIRTGVPVALPYDLDQFAFESGDPRTLQEWQYAADLADLALCVDAARQFGLITGGLVVNVQRCEEIIERAATRLIAPQPPPELLSVFVDALCTPSNPGDTEREER